MKTYITTKRVMPARVNRIDTLSQFYFKTGLWTRSPLWLIVELTKAFFQGSLWLHRKGAEMETRKVAHRGFIVTFATTVDRMSWLDEIDYFQSKSFKKEMVRRKAELAERKLYKITTEEWMERWVLETWELESNNTRVSMANN